MTKFKICCIRSAEEADLAISLGALAVGLVGEMPNGPGPIDDATIAAIAGYIHARYGDAVWTTLLTSRTGGADIADHVAMTGVNTVQIVDAPQAGAYQEIRRAHRSLRIIQVIHVEDAASIGQAREAEPFVDALLLDSGKPSAPEKTLGGTGDVHDWAISRRIVEAVEKPVFLAGGLSPENISGAIEAVPPFGVDICSGLRDRENGYALVREKAVAFAGALTSA